MVDSYRQQERKEIERLESLPKESGELIKGQDNFGTLSQMGLTNSSDTTAHRRCAFDEYPPSDSTDS